MRKRRKQGVFDHLKDWWWLYGVGTALCSAIVLWGGLPGRIAKAEQQLDRTRDDVDDLKGWAKELQGYTRAMQQIQMQQMNQMTPAASPTSSSSGEVSHKCFDERTWREIPCR